jgi:hypothetical protein
MIGIVLILCVAWATLRIEKRYGTPAAIVIGATAIVLLMMSGVWDPSSDNGPVEVVITEQVTPQRMALP